MEIKKTCFRLAVFSISNIDFAQTLPQSCKPYNRPSFSMQPIPAFLATIAGFSCSHYKLFMQSALPIHGSFNHYKLCLQCMTFPCSHYKVFMQPLQAFHAISIANSWSQCKPLQAFHAAITGLSCNQHCKFMETMQACSWLQYCFVVACWHLLCGKNSCAMQCFTCSACAVSLARLL